MCVSVRVPSSLDWSRIGLGIGRLGSIRFNGLDMLISVDWSEKFSIKLQGHADLRLSSHHGRLSRRARQDAAYGYVTTDIRAP